MQTRVLQCKSCGHWTTCSEDGQRIRGTTFHRRVENRAVFTTGGIRQLLQVARVVAAQASIRLV